MVNQTEWTGGNVSLQRRAWEIRRNALRMAQVQGQGYIGQALGVADVLAVTHFHALNYRAEDTEWEGRDRFYLSTGHYAIALYAANRVTCLTSCGYNRLVVLHLAYILFLRSRVRRVSSSVPS